MKTLKKVYWVVCACVLIVGGKTLQMFLEKRKEKLAVEKANKIAALQKELQEIAAQETNQRLKYERRCEFWGYINSLGR